MDSLFKALISISDRFSSKLLDNPTLFNNIRYLLAGKQENTKDFVRNNLIKYNCNTVLDLGCGTGDFSQACPSKTKYVGSDISEKYISYAKSKYQSPNRIFFQEDSLKSSINQKFDAVLLISMLHHFSDKEVNKILSVAKKRAKKIVIIADIIPDPQNPLKKFITKLDRGKFVRTSEEKLKLLTKHFKILNVKLINSRLAVQFGVICKV